MQHFGRSIVVRSVLELAARNGVRGSAILRKLGLDPEAVNRSGGFVPSGKIADAVEYAAVATGRNDFGLLLGARADHESFAALAVAIAHCETLSEVVIDAARHALLLNSGVLFTFVPGRTHSFIRFQVLAASQYPPWQYSESMLLMMLRFCRLLAGPQWCPAQVQFEHESISPKGEYERAFGCNVSFNQDKNAIVAPRRDFEASISVTASPVHAMVQSMLNAGASQPEAALPARVALLVRPLLLSGQASAERVASMLKLTPRTFQRRLAEHGTSFKQVVYEVRVKIVEDYINHDGTTGEKLASLLGFSQASAASRFLKDHMGYSAREIKANAKAGNPSSVTPQERRATFSRKRAKGFPNF